VVNTTRKAVAEQTYSPGGRHKDWKTRMRSGRLGTCFLLAASSKAAEILAGRGDKMASH